MEPFRGLSGISKRFGIEANHHDRQKIDVQADKILDACRKYLYSIMQNQEDNEELSGLKLEQAICLYLQKDYSHIGVAERTEIAKTIRQELEGFGPLDVLMRHHEISDVIVLSHDNVLYKQNGETQKADVCFRNSDHLRLFIQKLCNMGKRKVDEMNPTVSLTVPGYDGKEVRVNIMIPPLTYNGPRLAFRKFIDIKSIDQLVPETFSIEAVKFLKQCFKGKINIVYAGPMGTGKTTLIAVMAREFADNEIVLLIEEVRECPIEHPNISILVARPPNIEGKGEIKLDYILKTALQSSADRFLISEVRDGNIYYMLRSFLSGQPGACSLHASSPLDAVRFQMPLMLSQSPEAMGMDAAAKNMMISGAVHLIVQMGREYLPDEKRFIRVCTHISEVQISKGEPIEVKDIFVRENGELKATGYVPERILTALKK
ncbi:CpaF family protein [Desulfotomaculum varum]